MLTICKSPGLLVLSLLLSAGCRTASNSDCVRLERSLEGAIGWIVEGNEYHVIMRLRDDRQSKAVASEIVSYLKSDPTYCTEFPTESDASDGVALRQRDYWALVLAKLTDRPLHLTVREDSDSRDRKISELVVAVTGESERAHLRR